MDRLKTIEVHFNITGGDLRLKNVGIPVSTFCSIYSTTEVASLVSKMVYIDFFFQNVNMA